MDNLHIPITGDNQGFINALNGARDGVRSTARDIEQSGLSIEQMFGRIQRAAALSLAGFSAKEFIQKVVQVRGEFQQLEVAFTTMLGNAEKANTLMQQLTKTAAITPFDLQGVTQGAKQLLAYGIEAEKVNDTLIHLGDIAAGLSLPLTDLVYLYGTTMVQGRMFTQDLRQFQNRGIPIAEELAKVLGVTKDKVGELVTAGKVGAQEFNQAIMAMSSEGGKFAGLMENQSKTITGQISNIEDAIDVMFNNIGQQSEGIINGTLSVVSSLVENYEKVGKVILNVVAVYGVYKAAVMTVSALQTLQAAGIGALTAAETIHYGWLVLVQKAQALLNATMLANPYVLAATAVAGLVAVMINLKSQEDLVNEATDEYNRKKEEAIKNEEEHKARIEELTRVAGDESLSTDARRMALVELEQKYPSIFKKYDTEAEKLKHIRDINREIVALENQRSFANPSNERSNVNRRINELERKGSATYSTQSTTYGIAYTYQTGGRTKEEEAELQALYKRRGELNNQIRKNEANKYLADLTGVSNDDLQAQINERKSLLAKIKLQEQEGKKIVGKVRLGGATGVYTSDELEGQLGILEAEQNKRNEKKYTPSKQKAQLKKAWDNAKKDLADFDKSSTKYTIAEAEKERARLQEDVDAAEKKYKSFGGKSSKSEQSEADKKKREEERQRRNNEQANEMTLRLRQQAEDDETAVMQEGIEKRIKAINDAYEKEKATIDKQEREIKEKRGGTLTGDDAKTITAARQAAHKKYLKDLADTQKEELSAMYSYLKEYGSFEQQKLAITEDYEQKIRDAQTKGEKLRLTRERDNKLANLSFESVSMGIDWSALLNGVGNLSQEMLKPMLEQLEAYTKTDAYRDASMEEREKVSELIDELRNYVGTDQSTTWEELAQAISNFTASVAAYKEADKKEQKAVAARDEGKKKLERGEITQADFDALDRAAMDLGDQTARAKEEMQHLGQTLNETSDKVRDYVSPLTTALNKAGTWAGVQGMDAIKGSVSNIDALKGALDSALPSMGEGMAKTIGSGLSSALGSGLSVMGEGLSSVLSSGLGGVIGIVAQIPRLILDLVGNVKSMITGVLDSLTELISLRWIDDLVVSILDAVGNLIDAIFDLPENLYKVLESIVVNGVGGLLNSVLGRVGNILSFGALDSGGPASWFTNSNEKEVADTINRLTERNKLLQQSIEDLTDEMKTTRGKQAIRASREAEKLQKETNENYLKKAKAQAGYHSAHHSWNYYWGGYNQEQISRLSGQIGRSWNGDIWNLSPEEMKQLRSNVDMWEKIGNTGKGNYGGRVQEQLNNYIEQAGKLEEITNTLYENLTTTTKENVFDDFLNSLYDLADGSEDVFDNITDNWQAMVNRMVVNNLIGAKFQQKLEGWYEELAKLNEAKTNGDITDEEYRAKLELLKKQYEGYVTDAQRDIETLRNEGIIDATSANKEAYEQDASKGSWQSLGEETGQEINGRFAALQMSGEKIVEGITVMVATMTALSTLATERNTTVAEIRNLIIFSNAYLEDILKVNKEYYAEFKRQLDKIEKSK